MGVRERDGKCVVGERVNLTASFSRSPEVISDLTMPPLTVGHVVVWVVVVG